MTAVTMPRWVVYALVVALVAAAAFSLGAMRSASGADGDTYHACLYAGSLSQVGTSEPTNCGRGTAISWSGESPAGLNHTITRIGMVSYTTPDPQIFGHNASIRVGGVPNQLIIEFDPGTFAPAGPGIEAFPDWPWPVLQQSGLAGPALFAGSSIGVDGSYTMFVVCDTGACEFTYHVIQYIP